MIIMLLLWHGNGDSFNYNVNQVCLCTFQVLLSTPQSDGYKLLARFGNEIQEVIFLPCPLKPVEVVISKWLFYKMLGNII